MSAAPAFALASQGADLKAALARVLDEVGATPGRGSAVFLKPNFTYPFPKEGVTTSRAVIEALVSLLDDLGVGRVCLGEGEGGYNAFSMDETFAAFRLEDLADRHGLEVVNLNRWPSTVLAVEGRRGRWDVPIPSPLLEEFDTFITLPVPKVHAMTRISGAVKNQWGIVQDPMRLALHLGLDEILAEITRRLPNPIAVVDGTWGLTGNGPMVDGEAIELGWVAAADDLWLCDLVLCHLMGQRPEAVQPLAWGQRAGLVPSLETSRLPPDLDAHVDERFVLQRNVWNRLAKVTWYSARLNHLVYFSRSSGLLHRVMYSIRKKPDELSARGVDW